MSAFAWIEQLLLKMPAITTMLVISVYSYQYESTAVFYIGWSTGLNAGWSTGIEIFANWLGKGKKYWWR